MAELVSPGVSITVSDESFYAAAGTGTVPLLVIATAQDKSAPDGSGTAGYTTSANAGNVYLVTSQRQLLTNYGNPVFKTSGGTPLHGHELNEYGLQAAYSFLGLANRAYVLRADIDLGELEASSSAPTNTPANGSYWLDTANTVWGLKRWDGSAWVRQTVNVVPQAQITTGSAPKAAFGVDGDYAVVYTDDDGVTLSEIKMYHKVSGAWYHIGSNSWDSATSNTFAVALHTALPTSGSVGDLVLQMSSPNNGSSVVVKEFSASTWTTESVYGNQYSYQAHDWFSTNSGLVTGALWVDYNNAEATVLLKRHNGLQTVTATSTEFSSTVDTSTHGVGNVSVKLIVNNNDVVNGANGIINVGFNGFPANAAVTTVDEMVEAFQSALSSADNSLTDSADITVINDSQKIVITSKSGYDIELRAGDVAGFDATDIQFNDSTPYSNFESLSFQASATALTGNLADGTLWYDSLVSNDRIDIMINNSGSWAAFSGDVNIAASEPTLRSTGSGLVNGDLWIDSGDLENYPKIYKRASGAWVAVDTTDQVSGSGIIFADMRPSISGNVTVDTANAPSAAEYPYGILAWNKQLSGGNVKQWDATNAVWTDYSGNKADGSPYMLRKAQRRAVVKGLQAVINSNTDIRNESNRFNLIACPGYPELMDEMVSLATDRKETAFVVGDAPFRLKADATSTQNWATNAANATENGEDGLVTRYAYSAVYYPHGLTSDLAGNNIVVPGSHIALRTIAYNDQIAFPWFAPAGFQRGVVTNASSVGYVDGTSGEYKPVSLSEGERDSLYINKLNPIGNFPGRGLAVFGQKTLNANTSALDRVNVARLVVYIRERLDDIVKPFLFEPNDESTRANAKAVVDRFLSNLVTQRGLYDFVTVCDETNNTPERIDRNELHIDVAIQPVKAIEFIYIPIRVQNTLGQTG